MPDDDNISLAGTIISGAIGFYSYVSGNAFLQWLGAVLFGGFLTYYVQSRLQNRTNKSQIRKQNIENIFAPLYLEVKSIRENLLDFPEGLDIYYGITELSGRPTISAYYDFWEEILNSYKRFILGDQLEQDIRLFYTHIEDLNNRVDSAKKFIDTRIKHFFENVFISSIDGSIELYTGVSAGFYLEYERKFQNTSTFRDYSAYILKGISPLEGLQNRDDFSTDKCIIETWIKSENGSGGQVKHTINLNENLSEFNAFIDIVLQDVSLNTEIIEIREISDELLVQSKSIETALLNHISKYYPVEKVQYEKKD